MKTNYAHKHIYGMIESESIQSELASKTADELRKLADKIENREMFT